MSSKRKFEMSDLAGFCLLFGILFFFSGLLIGIVITHSDEAKEMRVDAVRHGHGEWIIGDTGKILFKWKEIGENDE